MTSLREELERRFDVTTSIIPLRSGDVELIHPRSAEALISEQDFAFDERLPYWADIWPASRALADHVDAFRGDGLRLLELGCGLGLVCVAAARAGFDVTATDYYDDALHFTQANVLANAAREPVTRAVDWRAFPDDIGTFDIVAASDVLYERPYGALVAEAFARTIAPKGYGLLTDPGRIAVRSFEEEARSRGLDVTRVTQVPYVEGTIRQTIDVYRLTHSR